MKPFIIKPLPGDDVSRVLAAFAKALPMDALLQDHMTTWAMTDRLELTTDTREIRWVFTVLKKRCSLVCIEDDGTLVNIALVPSE